MFSKGSTREDHWSLPDHGKHNTPGTVILAYIFQVTIGGMISYFVNYGIGIYQNNSPNIWRVPFGFQLVPAGIMLLGLFTIKVRALFFSTVLSKVHA